MANPNRRVAAESALYLYGISRSSSKKPGKISSPGIDGVHVVRPLAYKDFCCWVSAVDHASFAQALQQNMENLEWLALHGVRHQQAVGEIAAQVNIIPARFGTIFSGEQPLLKDVRGRKAVLEKVFVKISEADEWGVKVFAEPAAAVVAAASKARSGKEYLQQKAARMKKRPERNSPEVQELADILGKIAADSAPSGKVSGTQPNLLWQATFLVPRKRRKQWDQILKEFVKRWDRLRRIEVNGPWPPYSFVSDAD